MSQHNDYGKEQARYKEQQGKNNSRYRSSVLSYRRYSPAAAVFEVFFRHTMGERYFNGRIFLGGLCVLALIQTFSFGSLLGYDIWGLDSSKDFYIRSPFDWVLGVYVVFSLWQFIDQWRLAANDNSIYTHFMGFSRFYPIGRVIIKFLNFLIGLPFRLFGSYPPQFKGNAGMYVCYYVLEPFAALILSFIGLIVFNSITIALVGSFGMVDLVKQNYNRMRDARHQELDRLDSGKLSREMQREAKQRSKKRQPVTQQSRQRQQAPPIFVPPKRKVPPKPSSKRGDSAVERALRNLDPKLRNLGNKSDNL